MMGIRACTLLAPLLVAIAIPFLPAILYEPNYAENTRTALEEGSSYYFEQQNTTILITGANSGLGLATTLHFAQRATKSPNKNGVVTTTIVMTCRSVEKCNKARDKVLEEVKDNPNPQRLRLLPVTMDLSDFNSLAKLASQLKDQLSTTEETGMMPPIHILILNAGICAPSPKLEYHPVNGIESHYHTNHLGHAMLVHYLWPFLKAAASSVNEQEQTRKARIVTVGDGGSLFPLNPLAGWYPPQSASSKRLEQVSNLYSNWRNIQQYIRSKQAQVVFAAALQERYPDIVTASAVHPGVTRTPIYTTNFKGFPEWLKHVFSMNRIGTMSPLEGALMLVVGALDSTATYVGPKWFFCGPPVVVGRASMIADGSVHHRAIPKSQIQELWDRTIQTLRIARFGEATYVSM